MDITYQNDMDFDSLVNLEQTFFDEGFKDGYAHGRIHGLIEGRALGREKGFEMWEELGFYEGFAVTSRALLVRLGKHDDRKTHHITALLTLIAQFPLTNPKQAGVSQNETEREEGEEGEVDILKLLRQIRSKYKLVCAVLGVRPRVHTADEPPAAPSAAGDPESLGAGAGAEVGVGVGVGGEPTTKRRTKKSIWDVEPRDEGGETETERKVVAPRQDLSF